MSCNVMNCGCLSPMMIELGANWLIDHREVGLTLRRIKDHISSIDDNISPSLRTAISNTTSSNVKCQRTKRCSLDKEGGMFKFYCLVHVIICSWSRQRKPKQIVWRLVGAMLLSYSIFSGILAIDSGHIKSQGSGKQKSLQLRKILAYLICRSL